MRRSFPTWTRASVALCFALGLLVPVARADARFGTVEPLLFDPPAAERRVLSNGAVVYFMEDRDLPLFRLNLWMKVSPADVPARQRGAMSAMGTVWRSGGTRRLSPEALDRELELLAASVETGAGEETASISLSCLSRDTAQGLALFREVLLEPAFREAQLSLHKDRALESYRRRNDTPVDIARRAFRKMVYGADHVYAFTHTEGTIKALRRRTLVALHRAVVVPDHAVFAVSGDFDTETFLADLEALLQGWRPSGRTVPEHDYGLGERPDGPVFHVEKAFNQSRIFLGQIGISRHDAHHHALAVGNHILGGGGTSRLFSQIRSRMGLAYAVGSFSNEPRGPGLVGVGVQTRGDATVKAVTAIREALNAFSTEGPTDAEMTLAQDAMINSFVFRFDSPARIVNEQASLEIHGFAPDYLRRYPERIRAVDRDAVRAVAARFFDPEGMVVVVVGEADRFDAPLDTLGETVALPLSALD